jgi:UDP-N-acetylmuramate: L-alanyl-gamma-D-glutamyl-meso-diaminopimelate ligase
VHFVVEGDEYDTAFFDKTPKFLHYGARTLLITSVEFDHADIYRDLDHVKQAFRSLVAKLPADGALVAATSHPGVRDVIGEARVSVAGYGIGPGEWTWSASALEVDSTGTHFDVVREGQVVSRAFVPLFGDFNIENALGALVTAATLGVDLDAAVTSLASYRGVKRRQELRGEQRGVAVIDDFAHHPTAVRGSIAALRQRFPGRRIIAVFEPHTNTSRRAVFQDDYARAFDDADRVVVQAVPEQPIYSATGPVTEHFSTEKLVASLAQRGVSATCLASVDEIVELLERECVSGDVVLCMSNGAFGDIWQHLLDALKT